DLLWLVREHLGRDAELLERDSAALGRARAAAGLLGGGLQPGDVAQAVRRTRASVVHAHNLLPSLGWRALAAARGAGARVGLPLRGPVRAPVSVLAPPGRQLARPPRLPPDGPALGGSRLGAEKGIEGAIEACRRAQVPLVVAGDGPERAALERDADGARFLGA